MRIVPYKQTSCESCLPICLLLAQQILYKQSFSRDDELYILCNGMKGYRESYAHAVAQAFVEKTGREIEMYVDSKASTKQFLKVNKSKRMKITYQKITPRFLKELIKTKSPIAIYLDLYLLNRKHHLPHFVLLEKLDNKAVIIDPWGGKRRYLEKVKFMQAVKSLKTYIRLCPIVIVVK